MNDLLTWCGEHPYLTFFVVMAFCSLPVRLVLAIRGK